MTQETAMDLHALRVGAWLLRVVDSPVRERVGASVAVSGTVVVGREAEKADLALGDQRVSSRHCTVAPEGAGLSLKDCSKNGTFVNGLRVTEQMLTTGDVIRLGTTLVLVTREVAGGDAAGLIGTAPAFVAAREQARAAGANPVVLVGQTGTGKRTLAEWLHRRADLKGAFIAASGPHLDLPRQVREAHGGTLFVRAAGDIPAKLQHELVAALEHAPVRLVLTTHVDPARLHTKGTWTSDFFARVASRVVSMPRLRDRREDIEPLARHFAGAGPEVQLFFVEALEALLRYAWPYNVRELQQMMERLGKRDWPVPLNTLGLGASMRVTVERTTPPE